jgi:hypothetical protein
LPKLLNCLSFLPSFWLQNSQQFILQRSQITTIQLPQRLQKLLNRLLHLTRIHPTDAIANHLHLLTLGRQVIVRFEVLQPNGVLAIPHFHRATKVIHCADNRPAPSLASQFGIILDYNLADRNSP